MFKSLLGRLSQWFSQPTWTIPVELLSPAPIPVLQEEVPVVDVLYKVKVVTADGEAHLFLDLNKQTFVPRVDDTLHVTTCVGCGGDKDVEADVVEVLYDPAAEQVTVFADTDLDLKEGHRIDCVVQQAKEDGWELDGDVDYHGCCEKGYCKKETEVSEGHAPDIEGECTKDCEGCELTKNVGGVVYDKCRDDDE